MRLLPRARTWLATLAFLAVLVVGVRSGETPTRKQSCRLPDGTVVTLEGCTYGRGELRFASGRAWQQWGARLLPTEASRQMGIETMALSPSLLDPDASHLALWLSWKSPSNKGQPAFVVSVGDSQGHESRIDSASGYSLVTARS